MHDMKGNILKKQHKRGNIIYLFIYFIFIYLINLNIHLFSHKREGFPLLLFVSSFYLPQSCDYSTSSTSFLTRILREKRKAFKGNINKTAAAAAISSINNNNSSSKSNKEEEGQEKRKENELFIKKEKKNFAEKMEEKQNSILFPSLVKLDNFCRFLLYIDNKKRGKKGGKDRKEEKEEEKDIKEGEKRKEKEEKKEEEEEEEEEEWINKENNLWQQTLFPLAVDYLINELIEEKGEKEEKEEKELIKESFININKQKKNINILKEKLNYIKENNNKINDYLLPFICDLFSLLINIPLSPNRLIPIPSNKIIKEENKLNKLNKLNNNKFNLINDVKLLLNLPNKYIISFIAKQNNRFPLGLLSVARGRGIRKEEINNYNYNLINNINYIPQVLIVSPFFIGERSDKRKKIGGEGEEDKGGVIDNAQERVIDSILNLRSFLDINEEKIKNNKDINTINKINEENKKIKDLITPFPTTFWLCNDRLSAKISEIELTGWIKEKENKELNINKEIQLKVIYDNIRFIIFRWLLIPKFILRHFYANNHLCSNCGVRTPEDSMINLDSAEEINDELSTGNMNNIEEISNINKKIEEKSIQIEEKMNLCSCSTCACNICKLLLSHRFRGIGGIINFCRLRCLHMQFSYHLISPTTIGNMLQEEFNLYSYIE